MGEDINELPDKQKQIALMAEEKPHTRISLRLFETSRSEMEINMKGVILVNLRMTRKIRTLSVTFCWLLLAWLSFLAYRNLQEECWYLIARHIQYFLPAAAALPTAAWIRPLVDRESAELVYTLPGMKAKAAVSAFIFFVCWTALVLAVPFFLYHMAFPAQPLIRTIMRTAAQCFFFQALTFFAVFLFRSVLYGMLVFLLADGSMLLALLDQYRDPGIWQKLNAYEKITMYNPDPFSQVRFAAMIAGIVLLSLLGGILLAHYKN